MYQILNKQKQRVIEGKYGKEPYLFLVEQAYSKNKITDEQRKELIDFDQLWVHSKFAWHNRKTNSDYQRAK